jgi:hypothetical protein
MTDLVVINRIRNQIINYLALASSFDEQAEYQLAVPHINVPNEIINQWEDWVQEDWRRYVTEPVFSKDEVVAVGKFYAAWDSVAAATPDPLPPLEALWASSEWQLLALSAKEALIVFQFRGPTPDSSVEA